MATKEILIKHKSDSITPVLKILQQLPTQLSMQTSLHRDLSDPLPPCSISLPLLSSHSSIPSPLASLMLFPLVTSYFLSSHFQGSSMPLAPFSPQGICTCSFYLEYTSHRQTFADTVPLQLLAFTQMPHTQWTLPHPVFLNSFSQASLVPCLIFFSPSKFIDE